LCPICFSSRQWWCLLLWPCDPSLVSHMFFVMSVVVSASLALSPFMCLLCARCASLGVSPFKTVMVSASELLLFVCLFCLFFCVLVAVGFESPGPERKCTPNSAGCKSCDFTPGFRSILFLDPSM
jgi:hypothetical protein